MGTVNEIALQPVKARGDNNELYLDHDTQFNLKLTTVLLQMLVGVNLRRQKLTFDVRHPYDKNLHCFRLCCFVV